MLRRAVLSCFFVAALACEQPAGSDFPAPALREPVPIVDMAKPEEELDILVLLKRIPGLSVTEGKTTLVDYRFFQLEFEQPVDHKNPDGARFKQRLSLLHRDRQAPVVLHGSGYNSSFWSRAGRAELTSLLSSNQLDFEHRFFAPSRPTPADWHYLTIEQAAADSHRIVQAFRSIYGGRFLNTGASKGGMTAVYHRRFYPDDVYATVAYVAPNSLGAPDGRYIPFVNQAGMDADCRRKLRDYQRTALSRRPAMLAALMKEMVTFDRLGIDKAFEHAVLELPFGFWQYSGQGECPKIPATTADDAAVYSFLDKVGGVTSYSDQGIAGFEPYYFQAAAQLGFPAVEEDPLKDLLLHPGSDTPIQYLPIELQPLVMYDPRAMIDVADWLQREGQRMLFIYGSNDPWSAAAFELGLAADSYRLIVAGGNHGSRIGALPEAIREKALSILRRWAAVKDDSPGPLRAEPPLTQEELALQNLGDANSRRRRPL